MSVVTPTVKLQYFANTYSMHEYFLILSRIYGRIKLLPFILYSVYRQNTFGNDCVTCMGSINNKDFRMGSRRCWLEQTSRNQAPSILQLRISSPVTQLGPLAGGELASVQKVQWNNINVGLAFIEKLENITILKETYLIWFVFP